MQDQQNLTLGQRRVRLTFNPASGQVGTEVDNMKQKYADIIDTLEAKRVGLRAAGPEGETPEAFALRTSEIFRSLSVAQTEAERACRDAVFALTY